MAKRKVSNRPSVSQHKTRAPSDYVAWHEWADAQARAGHKSRLRECGHWTFDNEIHDCQNQDQPRAKP